MRGSTRRCLAATIVAVSACWPAFGHAQESVGLVTIAGTGCDNDQFHVTVARAGLDGGNPYTVHFVASVGGLIYTNQAVAVTTDGSSDYYIYTNFSAGSVANPGTFPMPSGQPIQIDVALERPFGKIITSRRMIAASCDSTSVQFNGPTPAPTPQSETLSVTSVAGTGCNDDQFNVNVQASNLDNGPYTMRAVATVAGQTYMNAVSSLVSDDTRLQYIYTNFSYGTVSNPGTFPMPAGQPVHIVLTLERPAGVLLAMWQFVGASCDSSAISSNAAVPFGPVVVPPIPALHPAGLALLSAMLAVAFAWRRRRK